MRALIKNSLAAGFVTFTAGLIVGDIPTATIALYAAAVPPGILIGNFALRKLVQCCYATKNVIGELATSGLTYAGEVYTNNRENAYNHLNKINPLNPDQNVVLMGALGSAVGALVGEVTKQNPVVSIAVGTAGGLTTGLFLSDRNIGRAMETCGKTISRLGAKAQVADKKDKEKQLKIQ